VAPNHQAEADAIEKTDHGIRHIGMKPGSYKKKAKNTHDKKRQAKLHKNARTLHAVAKQHTLLLL